MLGRALQPMGNCQMSVKIRLVSTRCQEFQIIIEEKMYTYTHKSICYT